MTAGGYRKAFWILLVLAAGDWLVVNLVAGPAWIASGAERAAAPRLQPAVPAASEVPSEPERATPATSPARTASAPSASSVVSAASAASAAAVASGSPARSGAVFATLYYARGATAPGRDSLAALQSVARQMKADPTLRPTFEGHADDPGNQAANDFMSLHRARMARAYVASTGVDPGRIQVTGFGNARKLDTSGTEEASARNRRVEITLK